MSARPFRSAVRWVALAGLVLATSAGAATPAPVKLASIDAMPTVVQKTVRAEAAGATIRGMFKEVDAEGKTTYEVEMKVRGMSKDISVGEDGTVLVSEQQMTLAELPEVVRASVLKAAGKRKIALIESVTKLGALAYYEAHVRTGKSLTEIEVGLDGKIME